MVEMIDSPVPPSKRVPLPQIARVFLWIGLLGFGGPAAHIALMEAELVTGRGWLRQDYFLELLAAINLMPGPTSTEMALQIGYVTGGLWGMLLAGAGFIVPAVVLSTGLAMLYAVGSSLAPIQGILLGVKPVVLVLILSAAYRLGLKAIDNTPMRLLLVLALVVVALSSSWLMALIGLPTPYIPELLLLLATGVIYVLWRRRRAAPMLALLVPGVGVVTHAAQTLRQITPNLSDLFWRFFIIGSTLFGSGYVLAAYMQRTFVDGLHWLTPQQLLDTLAIGQATPGPLLSTSAAAGYIITVQPANVWSGVPGALSAALGVFLPAFVVVLILGRVIPVIRRYPITLDFLKGVNAGVIALLIGAFATLAYASLFAGPHVDWLSLVLTAIAFVLLERVKWSPLSLIAAGACVGILRVLVGLT
jgi:chromate transporter